MLRILMVSSFILLGSSACADSKNETSKPANIEMDKDQAAKPRSFLYMNTSTIGHTLTLRLSLIPSPTDREVVRLMDIDAKLYFGLTLDKHRVKGETGEFWAFPETKMLMFTLGDNLDADNYSELYVTGIEVPVGRVYMRRDDNYGRDISELTDLCTGKYEEVCTLTYAKEFEMFTVKKR